MRTYSEEIWPKGFWIRRSDDEERFNVEHSEVVAADQQYLL